MVIMTAVITVLLLVAVLLLVGIAGQLKIAVDQLRKISNGCSYNYTLSEIIRESFEKVKARMEEEKRMAATMAGQGVGQWKEN